MRREKMGKPKRKQSYQNKTTRHIQYAEYMKSLDDHRITLQQFCQRYETDAKIGLTSDEAQRRLAKHGPNEIIYDR